VAGPKLKYYQCFLTVLHTRTNRTERMRVNGGMYVSRVVALKAFKADWQKNFSLPFAKLILIEAKLMNEK
jgi:hypothetical protein